MKKKLINLLFSKMMVVGCIILIELVLLFFGLSFISSISQPLNIAFKIISILMVIYVYNRNDNPSYKLAWISIILIVPQIGGVLYLLFGGKKVSRELRRIVNIGNKNTKGIMNSKIELIEQLKKENAEAAKQANYLMKYGGFSCSQHTKTTFIKSGEEYYQYLLQEIKKAEKFIFLEYFIIEEGKMWNDILDLLVEKVNQGVDVRLLFDDAGCITKLPENYDHKLRELGIKCKVFNPLRAALIIQMNNRDHRKITVIDNKVGFTGGINLADEYMNEKEVFGHWRDQGIMLEGEAVSNLTFMFLQFWDYGETEKSDYRTYLVPHSSENDGYVTPFSDSPTDDEALAFASHINIIHDARDYIYIQTPYLILDNVMKDALELASKNGVDVRIMVPYIPDKVLVNQVTKSNYLTLLKSGVRIYEYTPGFVHAKTIISDDEFGVIGSINFDYRSYFLHFENGVWLYNSSAIYDCKEDFIQTLDVCHEVTYDEYMKTNAALRLMRSILNLFSPLL